MTPAVFENKRTLRIEITAVRGLPSVPAGKMLTVADYPHRAEIDLEPLSLPDWAQRQLAQQLRELPEISGESVVKLRDPEAGDVSADVRIRRYVDARIEDVLAWQAEHRPDREALVDLNTERRYTYADLDRLSGRLGDALCRLGLPLNSHAAVVLPTGANNFLTKFAINRAGAVIVNVNFMERPATMFAMVRNSDSQVVFMRPGTKGTEFIDWLYENCPELRDAVPGEPLSLEQFPCLRHVVICDSAVRYPGTIALEDLYAEPRDGRLGALDARSGYKSSDDVCTIIHTSGTTATPKGTMLLHRSIAEVLCIQAEMLGLGEDSRTCLSLPLFHAFGSIGTSLPTFLMGGCVVCMDRPLPSSIADALRDERCTVLCNVPSTYLRLLEDIHRRQIPREAFSLKKCVAAGAASTEAMLLDVADTFGVQDVIATYGMTETATGVTGSRSDDDLEARTKTVGVVWPGVEMKFVDPADGQEVPPGKTGEIVVRGFNIMKGYYKMPEETAAVLSPDGWLKTGDLGYMRPDGHVCFVGRLKESIKKYGETISPVEIENVLIREPHIAASSVIGVPDDQVGEEIAAFVILEPGAEVTPEEIRAFCAKDLPRFKAPKYIFFVDTFPYSGTGKVLKAELRKWAEERLGRKQEST